MIDADWVARQEHHLLEEMTRLGFEHLPGTCTFLEQDGFSLDLVGFSRQDSLDRIGGGETVPVMVFGDLSRVLSARDSTIELPEGGGLILSPAALAVTKLMTVRVEKGSKDKLQALLLIEENRTDEDFVRELGLLLMLFELDRIKDALADAQAAYLAISGDAMLADAQSSGYTAMTRAVQTGLTVLEDLIAPWKEKA